MLLGNGKKKSIYDTITFVIMRLYILVATLSPVKKTSRWKSKWKQL